MHRRPGTQRPALRVAKAATSAVALCGFLGRVGKGVNAFAFSSCAHRRTCSLPSTASKSKVCKFAGQGMRRAGGQGAWRPTLSVVGRRSSRGGLLQLGSSAEDGAGEDEEAAREEVRPYLLPAVCVAQGETAVCNTYSKKGRQGRSTEWCHLHTYEYEVDACAGAASISRCSQTAQYTAVLLALHF